MNKLWVVVTAASAVLWLGRAEAAVDEELAEIRTQLQQLLQRVDKLEQENAALKAQNQALEAREPAHASRASDASNGEATSGSADWVEKISLNGDLRYRYEYISDELLDAAGERRMADRYRERIRARLNLRAQVTDDLRVGIGIATVEGGDPRSSNQSLDGVFSRKSFDLDFAYFDWKFAGWGNLIGGKMKQPFVVPGESLFWDGDVNPEGLALKLDEGLWFGTAYSYWVDEVSGPQSSRTSDVMLYGAQVGVNLPLGESHLMLAAHYYDLSAGVGRAPFYNGNPSGNTTVLVGTTPVLAYDYEVINLMAEFTTKLGPTPMQFWIDAARNRDPDDHNMAWASGVMFGKASQPKSWEVGAAYHKIEKDALFAQLIDADFAGGSSDSEGWSFSGGFVPARHWQLNATYFLSKRNADVGPRSDYDRLQLDFNVKF